MSEIKRIRVGGKDIGECTVCEHKICEHVCARVAELEAEVAEIRKAHGLLDNEPQAIGLSIAEFTIGRVRNLAAQRDKETARAETAERRVAELKSDLAARDAAIAEVWEELDEFRCHAHGAHNPECVGCIEERLSSAQEMNEAVEKIARGALNIELATEGTRSRIKGIGEHAIAREILDALGLVGDDGAILDRALTSQPAETDSGGGEPDPCPECDGTGEWPPGVTGVYDRLDRYVGACAACNGTGNANGGSEDAR